MINDISNQNGLRIPCTYPHTILHPIILYIDLHLFITIQFLLVSK